MPGHESELGTNGEDDSARMSPDDTFRVPFTARPVHRSDDEVIAPRSRSTHTIGVLQVSPPTYEEIARLLINAGYDHVFSGDDIVTIDMSGIGIQVDDSQSRDDRPEANRRQVGGSHYGLGKTQHWDLSVMFGWDPFQYQITKYVMRHWDKHGVEDLKKARHFLDKYIEEIEAGRMKRLVPDPSQTGTERRIDSIELVLADRPE